MVYRNCLTMELWILGGIGCKLGIYEIIGLEVMMVGRICPCMSVERNMNERFLVRMLNSFSRGSL